MQTGIYALTEFSPRKEENIAKGYLQGRYGAIPFIYMADCKLIRGDDLFEPAVIVDDIWRELNKAEIVIADITIHNANVFYEIGIAHTLGKKVILIRQDKGQDAPFDLKLWRYYEYNLSPRKVKVFKEKMAMLIDKILEDK